MAWSLGNPKPEPFSEPEEPAQAQGRADGWCAVLAVGGIEGFEEPDAKAGIDFHAHAFGDIHDPARPQVEKAVFRHLALYFFPHEDESQPGIKGFLPGPERSACKVIGPGQSCREEGIVGTLGEEACMKACLGLQKLKAQPHVGCIGIPQPNEAVDAPNAKSLDTEQAEEKNAEKQFAGLVHEWNVLGFPAKNVHKDKKISRQRTIGQGKKEMRSEK